MEVCIDSLESALEASFGGAIRLELCSALPLGGLTPSVGLLQVVKASTSLPVFTMLRPRDGDFIYSKLEVSVMKHDAQILKSYGSDGFVFGALLEDGSIDIETCKELIKICSPLPLTFHRAIDVSGNPIENLKDVISLGFSRVLTSGGESTALNGVKTIKEMIERHGENIIVMPGGGISQDNLEIILQKTRATEFHGSASIQKKSSMVITNTNVCMGIASTNDYMRKICHRDHVTEMMKIYYSLTI